jgi:hypothetical protein
MILDRLAFYRYIVRIFEMVLMLFNYMRGGGYWITGNIDVQHPVSILINHSNYMFGGEIC